MNLRRWLVLSIRGDIMSKELYDKRKEEFKNYVLDNHVLPRVWKVRFSDNTDMRLWFNKILKLNFILIFFKIKIIFSFHISQPST